MLYEVITNFGRLDLPVTRRHHFPVGGQVGPELKSPHGTGRTFFVITSYSIHYTKLYEAGSHIQEPAKGGICLYLYSITIHFLSLTT